MISDFHPQLSILLRLSSFAQFAGHSLTSDLSPVSPVAPVALRPSRRAVRSLAPKFSHLLSPVVAIFLPSIFLSQFPSPSLPHRGGEGGERRRPVISDFHPQLSILLRLSSFATFAVHLPSFPIVPSPSLPHGRRRGPGRGGSLTSAIRPSPFALLLAPSSHPKPPLTPQFVITRPLPSQYTAITPLPVPST